MTTVLDNFIFYVYELRQEFSVRMLGNNYNRLAELPPEERTRRARNAANARWCK